MLAAYTVNRLGSWIGLIALSLAVFDHTHAALAVAALLFAWQAVPAFVVPAVVVRVEASTRGHELSGLYFFEAVATAALAVLLPHFWLPGILLLAAVDGTASQVASALLRAQAARTGREDLVDTRPDHPAGKSVDATDAAEKDVNSSFGLALALTFVGGPVLGGMITAGLGAPVALLVDAATFAICAGLLVDLHPHVDQAAHGTVRDGLREAWTHITQLRTLRTLLLGATAALLFIQTAGPIEVVYAKVSLRAGDGGYGLLVTAQGLGALIGSLGFDRVSHRRLAAVLSVGTIAQALALIGYALAPTLPIACAAAVVGGVGNFFEVPALLSLVQRLTPPQLHGRLMGAVESMSSLCIAGGLLLGGALVAATSPRAAFAVAGGAVAAASVIFVRLTVTIDGSLPASVDAVEDDGEDSHVGATGVAAAPAAVTSGGDAHRPEAAGDTS